MIDETKLIGMVNNRRAYLQSLAAECDETGDITNMQLWDAKDFEMCIVLGWIAKLQEDMMEGAE